MKWVLIILMMWPNGNITATASIKSSLTDCEDVKDIQSEAAFSAAKYFTKHRGGTAPESFKAICGPLVED